MGQWQKAGCDILIKGDGTRSTAVWRWHMVRRGHLAGNVQVH